MRKLCKVLKNICIVSIAVILLVLLSVFIYHNYQLSKESSLIKSEGTLVNFNNKKINVYKEGSGEDTYVFMSGSGIAAPVYELKGLYSKFSKENKIAVIERAGYGYSDAFHDDRDIDTMLEQSREALIQSGNKPPYILVPHSISGIEAIYWAQKYPNEVKGIIALDIGLPKQYVTHKMNLVDSLKVRGFNLLTKMGVHRLFPSVTYNPEVIRQSFLTEHEKEMYKALSYKQFFNNDMEQELLQSYNNGKKSINLPIPKETPILFLDAIAKQNENSKYTKRKNEDYEEFAEQLLIADVIKIQGTHSIYLYEPDEIYNLAMNFINKKVEKH
ncbi:alpha/beta hydrolase [Bacillus pseudomycoides]|uniref:Alpha/beta hydrolase n=1 Tax=Bacillus pseudomycoides TaxID=64104 RepID=A0ABD6TAR0_9BACI|nr:alpha/beta hydrolase [Bacillus pseudomycoides]MCR8855867.1 alpha/beta hydrolase [Bacillus pseudomycoides]PEK38215.1 alpha/beta hydrolase [Bacillus pseudomycoides]PEK70249.1 alpha/beta hydrolase [Bacillus pseudomycoides]PEP42794.1 alpha/beta hydrolase [Bacillus pseudomycoides]PEP44903.1 alpha/beta hydrolase [Bacillus pseudomycoides]